MMIELSKYLTTNRFRVLETKYLNNSNKVGVLAYERHIPGEPDDEPYVVLLAEKLHDKYYVSDHGEHYSQREKAYREFNQLEQK